MEFFYECGFLLEGGELERSIVLLSTYCRPILKLKENYTKFGFKHWILKTAISTVSLIKRPMGHIAYLSNNRYNKISVMES